MGAETQRSASRTTEGYLPRRADETLLYGVVAGHLETFLGRAARRGRTVPRFVEREFRKFLDCGIPAHGFLRVRCDDCGLDRVVPFSCKGRGFCPSCGGRRMADTAAHLVDRVLPRAPVRQWVLSLPLPLRYRLAYDAKLTTEILGLFVRAVFGSLRRRAGRLGRMGRLRCAAVTFVQRFGDALNLNLHFHTLAIDGVFEGNDGTPLHVVPPPDDEEVLRVTRRVSRRLTRLLERRGLGPETDSEEADPLSVEQPLLAALYAASVRGRVASGPRTGQRVLRFGDRVHPDLLPEAAQTSPRCASLAGVSVHANVAVPANDRARLERLCRYVARPPLASERLERGPRNLLVYRLRHRWRDGTTHVLFEPVELLERLAALVPPPRFNLVRYHGVLAPAASQRKTVASHAGGAQTPSVRVHAGCAGPGARAQQGPGAPPPPAGIDPSDSQLPRRPRAEPPAPASDPAGGTAPHDEDRPRRYAWAELMRRVFTVDVLECPRCAGPMRILAAIHPPTATRAILECLDLPSRAPPVAPPVQGTAPDPFTDDFEAAVDPGA